MEQLIIPHPLYYNAILSILFSSPLIVKNKLLRRHGISVGYLRVSITYIFRSISHHYCIIIHFKTPVSVFSCYTLKLLCGSSSSRCTLIIYRDGGSAMKMGKLCNISLHVLYTSLVCKLPHYFMHNYLVLHLLAVTTSTHLPLLLYTVNINLCSIVYSVLHRETIIISSTHLDFSNLTQTLNLEVTLIS